MNTKLENKNELKFVSLFFLVRGNIHAMQIVTSFLQRYQSPTNEKY